MNFIHMFNLIDEDNSGEITKSELSAFMQANDFSENFVDKWMLLFDFNKRGYITIDDYCERLGLEIDEDMNKKMKTRKPPHLKLDDLDEFVNVDETLQQHIICVSTSKPLSTPIKPKSADYSFPLESPNIKQMYYNFENNSEDIIEEVIVQKVAIPLFGMPQSKKKKHGKDDRNEEFEEDYKSNKPSVKHSSSLPKHQSHSNYAGPSTSESLERKSRSLSHREHGPSNESHGKPNIRHKSDNPGKSKIDRGSKIEKVGRSSDNIADINTRSSTLGKSDSAKRSKKDKHKGVPELEGDKSTYDNSLTKEKNKSLHSKTNKKSKNKDLNEKKNTNENKVKEEKSKSSHISKSLGNIIKHLNKAPDKTVFEELVTPSEKPTLNSIEDRVLWKSKSLPNEIEKYKPYENESLILDYLLNDSGSGFIEGSIDNRKNEFGHDRSDYSQTLQDRKKGMLYSPKGKEDDMMKFYSLKSLNDLHNVPFMKEPERKGHQSTSGSQIKVNSLPKNKLINDDKDFRKRLTSESSKDYMSQDNRLKQYNMSTDNIIKGQSANNKKMSQDIINNPIPNSKSVDYVNVAPQYDVKTFQSDQVNNNTFLRGSQVNVEEEKGNARNHQLVNSGILDPRINKSRNNNAVSKSETSKDNPPIKQVVSKDLDRFQDSVPVNKELTNRHNITEIGDIRESRMKVDVNANKNQMKEIDYMQKYPDLEKQVKNTEEFQEFNKEKASIKPITVTPYKTETQHSKSSSNIVEKSKPLGDVPNKNTNETNNLLFPDQTDYKSTKNTPLSQTEPINNGSEGSMSLREKSPKDDSKCKEKIKTSKNELNNLQENADKSSKDNLDLQYMIDNSNKTNDEKGFTTFNEDIVKNKDLDSSYWPNSTVGSRNGKKRIQRGREMELGDNPLNDTVLIKENIIPSSSMFQYSVPPDLEKDIAQKDKIKDITTKANDNVTKSSISKELKILHKDINEAILSDLLSSIVNIYEESVTNIEYNCAELIKHFLDRYYDAMWHVVINDDEYELYFTYENMLIFQYDKLTFIIWKSVESFF